MLTYVFLCIFQVALGDVKNAKAANYVPVRMTVEGKKFVIGTLSADKGPQISFDLVLDKDFELSHDWKDGSIYFCGYSAEQYPFCWSMFYFFVIPTSVFFIICCR